MKFFIEVMNVCMVFNDLVYFSIGDFYVLVDDLNFGIVDIDGFIEGLNIVGEFFKCGRLYKSASALFVEILGKC